MIFSPRAFKYHLPTFS